MASATMLPSWPQPKIAIFFIGAHSFLLAAPIVAYGAQKENRDAAKRPGLFFCGFYSGYRIWPWRTTVWMFS